MKTSLIISSFVFAIAVVLVAGCTSLGSSGGNTPTPTTAPAGAGGTTTTPTILSIDATESTPTSTAIPSGAAPYQNSGNQNAGTPTAGITSLTETQQTEARSLAEANATIKSALSSGYTFYDVSLYDPTIPTATVQYMMNSNTELNDYIVIVDLSQDKVDSITLAQHQIPANLTQVPS